MNLDFLKNKSILVTGGTGSFGKNFVKKLLRDSEVRKIVIFSRDELKQSIIQSELKDERLRFFLGDVRERDRLIRAFHGIDIIIHAAALKQVPLLESNPFEAVKTNVIGSQNVIEAAIDAKVKKVILISTDKAANPVNLYGSTKLCAEKLFVNGNLYSAGETQFSCVRYGNVLGSRGSIVDIILQNPDTKEISITHEKMTRFWIDLEDAFKIVLFALKQMEGGEIFVPKVPTMALTDLLNTLVPKAKRKIIGIRPGEKLHETLLTVDEARNAFDYDGYYVILPNHPEINTKIKYKNIKTKGKLLKDGFVFSSDTNTVFLKKEELLRLVTKLKDINKS